MADQDRGPSTFLFPTLIVLGPFCHSLAFSHQSRFWLVSHRLRTRTPNSLIPIPSCNSLQAQWRRILASHPFGTSLKPHHSLNCLMTISWLFSKSNFPIATMVLCLAASMVVLTHRASNHSRCRISRLPRMIVAPAPPV